MTSGRALYFFPANFPFWLLPKKGFSNPGLTTFDHEDNHLRPSLETIAIELPFQSFKNIICKIHFMAFYGNSVAPDCILNAEADQVWPWQMTGGCPSPPTSRPARSNVAPHAIHGRSRRSSDHSVISQSCLIPVLCAKKRRVIKKDSTLRCSLLLGLLGVIKCPLHLGQACWAHLYNISFILV